MSKWTLFSNHGHVLVVLSRDPDARLRDVAQIVGITERAVQKIVRDLQDGGFVSVTKHGRRNRYRLRRNQPLRHTLEAHCTIGELLEMVNRYAPGLEPEDEGDDPDGNQAIAAGPGAGETPPPQPVAVARDPEQTAAQPAVSSVSSPSQPDDDAANVSRPAAEAAEAAQAAEAAEADSAEAAAPRRRKVRPAEDSEQGSLF